MKPAPIIKLLLLALVLFGFAIAFRRKWPALNPFDWHPGRAPTTQVPPVTDGAICLLEFALPGYPPETIDEVAVPVLGWRLAEVEGVGRVTLVSSHGRVAIYVAGKPGLSGDALVQGCLKATRAAAPDVPAVARQVRVELVSEVPTPEPREVARIRITVDAEKAGRLGVSVIGISRVVAETRGDAPDSPELLAKLNAAVIDAGGGRLIRLTDVAAITLGTGPSVVVRTIQPTPRAEQENPR